MVGAWGWLDGSACSVAACSQGELQALVPAEELSSLRETAYLLRSPKNAARLLAALVRSQKGTTEPVELNALMRELGLPE